MPDHVSVAVRDLETSTDASEAVLDTAGLPAMLGFGENDPEFRLNARPALAPLPSDTGSHICLRMSDENAIRAFHAEPMGAGWARVLQGLDRRR